MEEGFGFQKCLALMQEKEKAKENLYKVMVKTFQEIHDTLLDKRDRRSVYEDCLLMSCEAILKESIEIKKPL